MPDDDVQTRAAEERFAALRGRALQQYASLEQALFRVFAELAGLKIDVAATIFFKLLLNARTVMKVLRELLEKNRGDTYQTFWKSLENRISATTEQRNRIVHWNVAASINAAEGRTDYTLIPPDFMTLRDLAPIHADAIEEFIRKCDFLSRLCVMFRAFLSPQRSRYFGHMDAAGQQTWHDIFQQEVVYPPPDTHPLIPKLPESGSPPPPSPESRPTPS